MRLAASIYKTSKIMKQYVAVCAFFLVAILTSAGSFAQGGRSSCPRSTNETEIDYRIEND